MIVGGVILCWDILLFHVELRLSFIWVCNITCMDDVLFLFLCCGFGLGGADGRIDRF